MQKKSPSFLYLREISQVPTELHFGEKDLWLEKLLHQMDESTPKESFLHPGKHSFSKRKTALVLVFQQIESLYQLKGTLQTQFWLLCSRCANTYAYPLEIAFQVFLSEPHSWEHPKSRQHFSKKTAGTSKNSLEEQAGLIIVSDGKVEFSRVLEEQIRLHMPSQPLCQPNCQGLCSECGTNLNEGRCACEKLKTRKTSFSRWKIFQKVLKK